ncbi:MAG: diguanylate cyclase, partial [Pseudomonadota bacterium]
MGVEDAAALRGASLDALFEDDVATIRKTLDDAGMARVTLARRGAGHAEEVTLQATPMPDGRTIFAARDLTDVEHAASTIRTRERRLNKVLDTVNDAIVIAAADGAVERFNAAAERMFGWRESETIGRNIAEFIPNDSSAPMTFVDFFVRNAQADSAGALTEIEGRRRDGSPFPMEASIAAMLFEDRPTLVAVVRDLTERKAAEAKIRHAALHDTLTGLPNRLRFRQLVDENLAALRAGRRADFVVVGVNLDRFRSINDLFGFRFGDRAIQAMVARLNGALRADDRLARLTGDEFGVLVGGDATPTAVQDLCADLLKCRDAPVSIDGTDASISLRVALVRISATDAPADAQAVIQRLGTTL